MRDFNPVLKYHIDPNGVYKCNFFSSVIDASNRGIYNMFMHNLSEIAEQAKVLTPKLVEWRRFLHSNPEIGLEVPVTAGFVKNRLNQLDIKILPDPSTNSVVGFIPGSLPNKKPPMALRADMDALSMPEKNRVSYASKYENRMHACGHDGHMAMLLGAAELLCANPPERDIYLVFQPGEEGPGGAETIMKSGILKDVREIYAIHLDPTLQTGTVGINTGRAMASNDDFYITIKGKGGHAGLPHQAVDPIAIAAQIINSFQFIVSRLVDPVDPSVVTLGKIEGGYMPNAIAEEVRLAGTIRAFSNQVRNQIQKELKITTEMFCKRYGSEYNIDLIPGYPPVINSRELSVSLMEYLEEKSGNTVKVHELTSPRMTAEDFSYYLSKIPGVFYWLGCRNSESTSYPLHHPCFNMDENVLALGAYLHTVIANK